MISDSLHSNVCDRFRSFCSSFNPLFFIACLSAVCHTHILTTFVVNKHIFITPRIVVAAAEESDGLTNKFLCYIRQLI